MNAKEFRGQVFDRLNERSIEYGFVFRALAELCPRHILDVGTGTTALPQLMRNCGFLVTAIDNVRDFWPAGMRNRHFHIIDDDITATCLTSTFDLISCISVLEHIQKPRAAIRNMFSLLKPGGHLILTFPYNEMRYVRNVYDLPGSFFGQGAHFITQSYSRSELQAWLRENSGTITEQDYWQCWEGELWSIGNQLIPPVRVTADDRHQLTCLLIKKVRDTANSVEH